MPGLALLAVCLGIARFAYGYFVPTFEAAFALELPMLGIIASAIHLGYLAAIIASWIATDRLGPRPVALAAGTSATLGLAVVAGAPGVAVLAAGFLIAGASAAVIVPPLAIMAGRPDAAARPRRISRALAAGTGLGVLAVPPFALVFLDQWRLAWGGLAVTAAAATAWAHRQLPPDHDLGRARSRLPGDLPRVADAPRRSAGLVLAAGLLGAASAAVWVFGPYVADQSGPDEAAGPHWLWLLIGSAALIMLVVWEALERVHAGLLWRLAMLALAAATATFGLADQRWTLTLLAAPAFGAAYVVATGTLLRWGASLSHERTIDGMRLALLAAVVGHAVGAGVLGELLALFEPTRVFNWTAGLAVLAAVLAPRRRPHRGPHPDLG